jgi:GTP cyclohydrolase II
MKVSEETSIFASALGEDAHVAFDRAAAEFRAGRPIVIENGGTARILAALDSVSPNVYATFRALPGAVLVLTAKRGQVLGFDVKRPAGFPLARLDRESAHRLATTPHIEAPADWVAADATAEAALDVCKHALMLPAVLSAGVPDNIALPTDIYRVPLDRLVAAGDAEGFALEIVSEAKVPLTGNVAARFLVFRGGPAPRDQVAVVIGDPDPDKPVPVRVHSACLTGDLFGSLRCDCGDQLRNAVAQLNAAGGGVLLYLDQEGRGIGIGNKMRAYALQDQGFDTIDADGVLGFDADERNYSYAAAMLSALGYRRIVLLTNNPSKIAALNDAGIEVTDREGLTGLVTPENLRYLNTKAKRANHMLDALLDLAEPAVETRK